MPAIGNYSLARHGTNPRHEGNISHIPALQVNNSHLPINVVDRLEQPPPSRVIPASPSPSLTLTHPENAAHLLLLLQSWCGFSWLHGSEVFSWFQFVKLWFADRTFVVVVFRFFSLSFQFLAPFPLVLWAAGFLLLARAAFEFLQSKDSTVCKRPFTAYLTVWTSVAKKQTNKWPTERSTGQSAERANERNNQSSDWSTDRTNDRPNDRPNDRKIDRPIDRSNQRTHERTNERKNERTKERTNKRTNERTNEWRNICCAIFNNFATQVSKPNSVTHDRRIPHDALANKHGFAQFLCTWPNWGITICVAHLNFIKLFQQGLLFLLPLSFPVVLWYHWVKKLEFLQKKKKRTLPYLEILPSFNN